MSIVKALIWCPCGETVYSKTREVEEITGLSILPEGVFLAGQKLPSPITCPKCSKVIFDGKSLHGNTSVNEEE